MPALASPSIIAVADEDLCKNIPPLNRANNTDSLGYTAKTRRLARPGLL